MPRGTAAGAQVVEHVRREIEAERQIEWEMARRGLRP